MEKDKHYWGFDTKSIDTSVRPGDDFYTYANGGWLKRAKMPADEARWGSFNILRYKTQEQLKKIVESTRHPQISGLYRSAMDMKRRNKLGAAPLAPLRSRIRSIRTKKDLSDTLAHLHVLGISGGWGSVVDQDSKDSTRYLLHLWQGGLGMPERDYYLLNKPEQKRVRRAYVAHVKKLSQLAGASATDSKKISTVVLGMETALAKVSMRKEDTRDPEKVYHKYSVAQLQRMVPAVPWQTYLKQTHAQKAKYIIVGQPAFFKAIGKMLETVPLDDWKTYLEWHVINDCAGMLSDRFVKANFAFYGTTLTGTKAIKPLWRRALGAVGAVGEELGKLYVQKHFPASSKRAMDTLVSDLFEVYAARIKALSWMGPATKRKALTKLRLISRKIAYPRYWRSYKGLHIDPGDYFGNLLRAAEFEHMRQMRKLGRPVDRGEWFMTPQTVNAYFSPNLNDIVFPAAILQWPFFDARADDAVNYAGIGSVIGHEMTHGFDDQGAKFDGKGTMRSWWSTQDRKNFEAKSKTLVAQADAHEVQPGVTMSGRLTLGENIADLGGLAIAYDAYQKRLAKTGRKIIAGLSPEERFFLGFAQIERELARPEHSKMQALTDPHAHAPFRINGPVSNFAPFYEAYKLSKKDKLYRPPNKRAEIW